MDGKTCIFVYLDECANFPLDIIHSDRCLVRRDPPETTSQVPSLPIVSGDATYARLGEPR